MTLEEAIKNIKEQMDLYVWQLEDINKVVEPRRYEQCRLAIMSFEMGIKALEQQPCEDCISRKAAIDELELQAKEMSQWSERYMEQAKGVLTAKNIIKDLPPVTLHPKTGHWIEQIDHEENCRTLICSNCDRPALHDEDSIWKHKFCPHCGAKMVEPQESEDEE